MKTQQVKQVTDQALGQLITALEQGRSATLTHYLGAMARFHRYSFHNVMLIYTQKDDASHVAGFHSWRKLGRFVKKGEKGILILAPMIFKRNAEPSPQWDGLDRNISVFRHSRQQDTGSRLHARAAPRLHDPARDPLGVRG